MLKIVPGQLALWIWNFGCQLFLQRGFSGCKKYQGPQNLWVPDKGPIFSERDWYYLQAQTDMPFYYLKLIVWIFPPFFQVPHCKHTGSADSQLLRRTVVWNVISKFKFKIVIWNILLSPIKFSEKKGPLCWSVQMVNWADDKQTSWIVALWWLSVSL